MAHESLDERDAGELPPQSAEARFRALIQNATDIITIHEVSGTTLYATPSASRILGHPPGALIGKSPFDSIHPRDVRAVRAAFDTVVRGAQPEPVEFRFRHADGSWIHLEGIGNNLLDHPGIEGIVLTSRDISARKQAEHRIRHLATHDVLTGLPNRFLLEDRLRQGLAQAAEARHLLALMFVDLDQFRLINDSLGHHAGDELLQEVASRIARSTRAGDTVARIAGDTFAALLPDAGSVEHVSAVGQRILAEIARPVRLSARTVTVTASIGMSLYPADAASAEDLLNHAETAMQSAKNSGRNAHRFYTDELNARVRSRALLEHDLQDALAHDQLTVEYQPKVALADGSFAGVEALVRWQHPRLGTVPPETFIPIAEESGLIARIGAWVLRSACRQLREWRDAGLELRVAVNLSPWQFRDDRLVDAIATALREADVPAYALELEITESALLEDVERAVCALRELKARGVRIAIDDFGTGYSNLSYLHRLPLDVLKLDQTFVGNVDRDAGAAAIVKAIIALAKSLGLSVVAEGVETVAQREFLERNGCDYVQGYLIGAPVAPAKVAELAHSLAAHPA
ncbi:MAG TPA: EAL domain-containing protein [Burkholderiales bacterium]|nr:EAL domain-containing protein [Burkholderiales bacterium]